MQQNLVSKSDQLTQRPRWVSVRVWKTAAETRRKLIIWISFSLQQSCTKLRNASLYSSFFIISHASILHSFVFSFSFTSCLSVLSSFCPIEREVPLPCKGSEIGTGPSMAGRSGNCRGTRAPYLSLSLKKKYKDRDTEQCEQKNKCWVLSFGFLFPSLLLPSSPFPSILIPRCLYLN